MSGWVVTVLRWMASVIPMREGERARAIAAEDDDIVLYGIGTSIGGLGHASRFDPYSFQDPGSASYSKQVGYLSFKNRSPIISAHKYVSQ